MGVASFAMFGILFFFYKSIQSIVLFFIWKNKINTVGTIKALKDRKVNYDKRKRKIFSIDYVYEMEIKEAGKEYTVEYIESVEGDNPGKTQLNHSLPVYFDLENMQVRDIAKMKKDMRKYPLGILICVAVFVVCCIIVIAID